VEQAVSWYVPLLGREFADDWTCWQLCTHCLREQFGVEVPDYAGVWSPDPASATAQAAAVELEHDSGMWIEIPKGQQRAGDVAEFLTARRFPHVAIFVSPTDVLHVNRSTPTRLDKLDDVARYICPLSGIYRHRDLV
jgi:NlpC/P60 family